MSWKGKLYSALSKSRQKQLTSREASLDSALALEARLVAERDGAQEISWPKELNDRLADPTLSDILNDQIHQFEKRRGSLEGQKSVLELRIVQLHKEIDGISVEKTSTESQTTYINQELVGLRDLAGKNLVPVTRVYAMEASVPGLRAMSGALRRISRKRKVRLRKRILKSRN